MNLFNKPKDIKKLSEEELRKEYKKLSDLYDKKPTQDTAILMNEVVDEWKRRDRQKNLPKTIEEPPLEVQQAMHDIDESTPPKIINTEPEKPVEIIPMDFIKETTELGMKQLPHTEKPVETQKPKFNWFGKPKKPNGHTTNEWGKEESKEQLQEEKDRIDEELERIKQEAERKEKVKQESKFKKSLKRDKSKIKLGGFFGSKGPKEYCIKCKHEAKHHTRKDGSDEGCKICGCLKTLNDIQSQEEKSECKFCKKPVYVIEATMLNEEPYHHKCYEEQMWKLAKEDKND